MKLYLVELVGPRETVLRSRAGVGVSRAAAAVTNASKWRHVFDLSYRRPNIVMTVFYPGFQKSRVPSEKGIFSAVSGPSKGNNKCSELKKKGIISAVNGRKRALLTKSALEWHNKRGTAQSAL